MLLLLTLLLDFSAAANASTYPIWAQCSTSTDCVAIPGLCREWDYVNRQQMGARLKANAERRQGLPCVGVHVFMTELPVAACFHGLCTNARDIDGRRERCTALRERLDFAFTLANSCDDHEDCERGLANCGEECEFHVYPKQAKLSLAAWQAHYVSSCARERAAERSEQAPLGGSPRCKKACVDPSYYLNEARGVRCVEGRCVFAKLRGLKTR